MPTPTITPPPTPNTIRLRPRYLRAIPSLVVLTTAMAWGALPDWDVGDDLHKKASVTLSQTMDGAGGGAGTSRAVFDRFSSIE